MRIALLTLESLVSAVAVRRFVLSDPGRIALVGLSDPFRRSMGGPVGQMIRHVRRSGLAFLPYLLANFTLPRLAPRGPSLQRRPLATLCRTLDLTRVTVADVNGAVFRQQLAESGAERIVTFHFDQILTADTLAAAPGGGLNVHPSLLPRHRGPTPTVHALLEDAPMFGVTVHRLAPRIDAGDIVAQRRLDLPPSVTALEAARRLHEAGAPLLEQVLTAAGRLEVDETGVVLPYQGFPTRADLRNLRALGRSAAGWGDVRRAFATAI